jgi:hypothetical protein
MNSVDRTLPAGTTFTEVVAQVREASQDSPVLQSLLDKTGHDYVTFIHNGRVVKPSEYDSIELKEGDEVRWMLPYAGG